MRSVFIALSFLSLGFAATATAHDPPKQPPPNPPAEAVEACRSAKDGDSCSFKIGSITVEGVCRTPPIVDILVCVPPPAR